MEAPTWLRHTLEEIIGQIRRLLDVSGCAFQVVDFEEGMIRPAAQWFATDDVRSAMSPVLERPYDADRPGVTEAAIESGDALLIERFDDWEGAAPLMERLLAELDPADAQLALADADAHAGLVEPRVGQRPQHVGHHLDAHALPWMVVRRRDPASRAADLSLRPR